ncbi:MAG TPA: hypothetical protein VEA15_07465, partial [Caulobacteraceae bacterium]|nr:hypothetical protein [Caulobacteraceae bacterium]
LGGRWREFRDSLLIPRATGKPVRTTTRPEAWFDLGLLRAPGVGIDPRYHAAMPNLLVGAGLLFTFLGLSVALGTAGGVVTGTAAVRNDALRLLLETASFKFVTSLCGMLLSIVYALHRKARLKIVEQALDGFQSALEARVPLLTPSALQQEANGLLERQSIQLETFSTDLALNLGAAFDRAFDERLGEHIGPLTEAMRTLAEGMSSRNEQAMGSMLDAFLQRLQGGTGDRMHDVAESLAGLGAKLEGLQQGLGEAAVRMTQSADAMAARMGEGAEAALSRITDQMGGLTETLRLVSEQSRAAGTEAGEQMAARIEAAAAGFEESARGVATTLAHAAQTMESTMGRQAEASGAKLAESVEAMTAQLAALAENSRAAGANAFDQLAQRVAETSTGLERTVERISALLERSATEGGSALGRGAEQAVTRIADATEGMRTELQAMMAELRTSLGKAGEELRESGSAGAATLRTALGEAGGTVATALTGAADRLSRAGSEAGDAISRGGEAAGGSLRDAGGTVGERAVGLARQIDTLTEAAGAMAARSAEFERAAAAAAGPLVQTSANLNAASQSVRSAVEPMQAAARDVGRAIEQVTGAVARFDAAAASASRLTDSLNGAVARFEGVDRELAKTLMGLQTGLQAFTRDITAFVNQTDQNLAKAATQLGSLVKSLEATLEDFEPALQR